MDERHFDAAIKKSRGLELFLSLSQERRVPPWNVIGLKDVVDASEEVKRALDAATCVEPEQASGTRQ